MKLSHVVATTALLPTLAAAADFSGTWKLDNTFNGSVSVVNCTLVQTGDVLTGTCKPDLPSMEPSKLTGTVKGSQAKWGYDLVFNDRPARVDFDVTLADDGTMAGNLLRNGSASPIKGKRQPRISPTDTLQE